jgi:hypothetical protein
MQVKHSFSWILIAWLVVTTASANVPQKQDSQETIKTKVFLKTDKDIYSPGEKIRFVARLFDCRTEALSMSDELIVMIKGEKGEIIADEKFRVEQGIVTDVLELPAWSNEGMVSVIAFTPNNMVQNEAALVAIKPILINALRKNDYLILLDGDDKVHKPGDEVDLQITMTPITPGSKKEKVALSLVDFGGKRQTLKYTLVAGTNRVRMKIPQDIDKGLWLEVVATQNHFCYAKAQLKTVQDKIFIEFFPEGGQLLANSVQKIVYRAVNAFGEALNINAKIFDQGGHHVGIGKTLKPGVGLISLMPMPGQEYWFEIEGPYGTGQKFQLPNTLTDGVAIAYLKTENQLIRNQIRVVGKYIDKKLTVGVYKLGNLLWNQEFQAKDENRMEIPAGDFPRGVLTFRVSDEEGKILSQRMIYNGEPLPEGQFYRPVPILSETDEKVSFTVGVSNILNVWPDTRFDVKVIDSHSLFHQAEQPEIGYFQYALIKTLPETVLDLYIINTELVGNKMLSSCFSDEKTSQGARVKTLSGIVSDKKGRPVPGIKVMAFEPDQTLIRDGFTNEKGHFVIEGVDKNREIRVKALDPGGKVSYEVKLFSSFQESLEQMISLASFGVKKIYDPLRIAQYYDTNREVIRESQSGYQANNSAANVERMLQSGSSILDVIRMMKAFDIMNNQIVFYGGQNSLNFQSGALIVIDGQKMGTDISALNSISPLDVVSISVSTDPMDIQKYTGLNSVGIIEIATRGANQTGRMPNFKEMGKESQAPEFSAKPQQTTRLWLPGLPAVDGKLNLIFDPGEIKTGFTIQIDAVSKNGETVSFREVFSNE